jgi:hypothetical protein
MQFRMFLKVQVAVREMQRLMVEEIGVAKQT